jgi:hypothetical protein
MRNTCATTFEFFNRKADQARMEAKLDASHTKMLAMLDAHHERIMTSLGKTEGTDFKANPQGMESVTGQRRSDAGRRIEEAA